MNYAGLDWSDTVAAPDRVIAVVHVHGDDMPILKQELANVRARITRPTNYVFKHVKAKPTIREEFYPALRRVPSLCAHVLICSKSFRDGRFAYIRVARGIMALMAECPDECLVGHTIYIDYPNKTMRKTVEAYRTALRNGLKVVRKPPVADMLPRPDSCDDGAIVQVADMIAGEVREHGGLHGRYLPALRSRIRIV